jgi:hypothetical protein
MNMNDMIDRPANVEIEGSSHPGQLSPNEVNRRAYFHYVNSGRTNGHDLEHWFHAEQDLLIEQRRITPLHGLHN